MGGNFQNIVRNSIVKIRALPSLPAAPLMVLARRLIDRKLEVSFSAPASGAELVTGYVAEISDSSTFNTILATSELSPEVRMAVFGPLVRGLCYYYRVTARNTAGLGANAIGLNCSGVYDSPSPVRNVTVKTISEEAVLLQWYFF
jgi:hypothetical protein